MKFLYMAPVYIEEEKPDGVGKKVLNHYTVFGKRYDAWLAYYGKDGVVIKHGDSADVVSYGNRHRRYSLYTEVKRLVAENKFEAIYIRYPKSDPNFLSVIREMKQSGSKVVIEIPTYPYNGNLKAGFKLKLLAVAIVDYIYRRRIHEYVDRIVTYSDDDAIFGIPTIRTINGISFDAVKVNHYTGDGKRINLISVATNYECHGFDRIISGLKQYYAEPHTIDVDFHIIGDGPAIATYKKMIGESIELGKHVFLDGFLSGEKLEEQYGTADIAVNSLALYRLGLKKESTLKTKEYAAKGLPIISSTFVDALTSDGNRKFVLKEKDCSDPIKIQDIIEFYDNVYHNLTHEDVSKRIRNDAREVCDMSVTLSEVVDFFEKEK